MLLLFIIAYLIGTVLIGMWAARRVKTTGDFMLAGRSLPLMLSSAALFATWFGSETVFGASSEFLNGGLFAVIEDPFGAALCLVLFGMFYTRKLYDMNLLTLGDFFRVRFGRKTELIASLFLAPPYVGYIAAQLVAMALILNAVTGIEIWIGVVASSFVVTLYTYVGGMWAISVTDFIQSILIIVGLLVLAAILADKAGGVGVPLENTTPDTFRFLPSGDFKSIVVYVASWSVLGLGSIPSQDVFQRAMSANSSKTAVYSCYLGAVFYLIFAMVPLFISLCTKHLYGNEWGTEDAQVVLPNMVLQHTALPIQILFFGSLLSAIMSTTSSAILAPASIFTENLIKPVFQNRIGDRQMLMLTKLSVVLFSGMASIMACLRTNIYELVGESSILSLVSLFIPLTLGLYWNRSNATGAILSMITGIVTWIIFEITGSEWPSLVPATIVSLVFMIAGSLLGAKRRV